MAPQAGGVSPSRTARADPGRERPDDLRASFGGCLSDDEQRGIGDGPLCYLALTQKHQIFDAVAVEVGPHKGRCGRTSLPSAPWLRHRSPARAGRHRSRRAICRRRRSWQQLPARPVRSTSSRRRAVFQPRPATAETSRCNSWRMVSLSRERPMQSSERQWPRSRSTKHCRPGTAGMAVCSWPARASVVAAHPFRAARQPITALPEPVEALVEPFPSRYESRDRAEAKNDAGKFEKTRIKKVEHGQMSGEYPANDEHHVRPPFTRQRLAAHSLDGRQRASSPRHHVQKSGRVPKSIFGLPILRPGRRGHRTGVTCFPCYTAIKDAPSVLTGLFHRQTRRSRRPPGAGRRFGRDDRDVKTRSRLAA
jgi:hypothetical protein